MALLVRVQFVPAVYLPAFTDDGFAWNNGRRMDLRESEFFYRGLFCRDGGNCVAL